MEERKMLPLHVRQVGSADASYTVYVEDYVETYIRKQRYTEKRPVISGYLYGEIRTVEGERKCLIYGAAEDTRLTKERGKEKGKKYFEGYPMIGWFAKGSKDKLPTAEEQNRITEQLGLGEGGVLYIGDGENSAMLCNQSGVLFPLSGHLIFYERNEAMQEYMIRTGDGKSIESETVDQAAVHFREIMQKKEEKPEKKQRETHGLPVRAASVVAVLCLGGSVILAGSDDLKGKAFSWIRQAVQEQEEKEVAVQVIPGELTLGVSEETEEESETAPPETVPIETAPAETVPQETKPAETAPPETKPVETPPETPPATTVRKHVVSKGETLHGILKQYYGDELRLREICQYNSIENPDEILVGQVIQLP